LNAPAIPIRAAKTLADLEESSVQVSHADVVWLVRLAERIERPAGDELGPLPGAPLIVGGNRFWPMTWLATDWYYKWSEILEESGEKIEPFAFPFAHTRSTAGDRTLLELDDFASVKKAIKAWVISSALTEEHIVVITRELTERWASGSPESVPNPDRPETEAASVRSNSDQTLAVIASRLGNTPDYWRYDVAMTRTIAMYNATAKSFDAAGSAPDPQSPRIRAIHNYHQAVKWVIKNGQ
jgi:hypothetical protein